MDRSHRNIFNAVRDISEMAERSNLSQITVDRAYQLFKHVDDRKILKCCHASRAAACFYIPCRQVGVPRTFKEVCAVSGVSEKKIRKRVKRILDAISESINDVTTGDFISRYCSNLCNYFFYFFPFLLPFSLFSLFAVFYH